MKKKKKYLSRTLHRFLKSLLECKLPSLVCLSVVPPDFCFVITRISRKLIYLSN
uniref:Uncharacterized protein n=1 Tax=Octopus bimaculoides TaxID=37653 RepID=A0A0L8FPY7_OCTBM